MLDSSATATDSDSLDSLVIPADPGFPDVPPPDPKHDERRSFKITVMSRGAHLARVQGNAGALDNTILNELRDFMPGAPRRWGVDRVVFVDDRIAAVIRRAKDGSAIVTRFT
jgi:hypothetical protein